MSRSDEVRADQPLISEEARAWIGQTFELTSSEIGAHDVHKYVIGTDDRNPAYTSGEAALEAGHPAIPTPPLFYLAATRPLVWRDELTSDGGLPDRRVPIGSGFTMAGEYDIEFVAPVYVGDRLNGVRTLESLSEKNGSRRRFVVAVWKTEFVNQDGRLVIRETSSQLLF